jgi:hypothetical protein
MGFPRSKRTRAVALAVAAVGVVTGGIAYASIPSSGGIIHGCYMKSSGVLRVIDTDVGAACKSTEKSLDWNAQGLPGLEIVTDVHSSAEEVLEEGTFTATCPTGKKVIGGGANHTSYDGSANRTVLASWPSGDDEWSATFSGAGSGTGFKATVYAICALVS